MFNYPHGKSVPVSVIIPCYNAEGTIEGTIKSILNLDYPKSMLEVIVVDDKSIDNSVEIVKGYVKKHSNVRLIQNSRNSGSAAEPTNIGIKNAKYDYVAVADDDSIPERSALKKMIGFLQKEEDVGGVTCAIMSKERETFIQKLQSIEYTIIAWSRKLLDFVDSVYVTPGPFALYRKNTLLEIGLFDTKNMTQDIEIVWRMLSRGYKTRMCLAARVYSKTPSNFKAWFKQRIRWNIGGKQTLWKYKHLILKRGMLGLFIIPFFGFSLFLGLLGFGIFIYLFIKRFLVYYLSTKYSLYANASILHLQDLTFSPSILNLFGIALFVTGVAFALFGIAIMKERKNINFLSLMFYSLVYLTLYPVILIFSSYKLIRGNYSW